MKKIINWFFSKFSLFFLLLFWFLRGTFKTQPIRWFVAILSISLGVGLAVSINIVNKSAISEFNHSSNLLRGNASFQITGKSGFFNELIFDEFVELKKQFGFSEVSPVINLAVIANNNESVNLLGMDFFRVINTTPSLSVIPENDTELTVFPKEKIKSNRLSFIDENSIFISNTIKKKLNVSTGDNLKISYAGKEIFFNIAGGLSTSIDRDIAVIDIAAFQKKFGFYGKISRLDIKVLNDFSIEKSKSLVDRYLKEKNYIHLIETVGVTDLQKKNNNLSRAYYVNLSILGLVALFTGMFLLYSVMTTSVQQQISEFALMRTIGLSKNELLLVVIMMGTFLSLVGSLIGVFAGLIIAKILYFGLLEM